MISAQKKRSRSPSPSREHPISSKRKRDRRSTPDLSRSEKMYFLDPDFAEVKGDIYLRIDNVLFPCICEKLAEAGGFFGGLFSIPQPEQAELVNGLPYCDMLDCSADDLRPLLQLLHGFDDVFWATGTEDGEHRCNLENVLSVLKLSARFDLASCRNQAIDAFGQLVDHICRYLLTKSPAPDEPTVFLVGENLREDNTMGRLSFKMVNIFQECDLPQFMPFAYYFAAQQPVHAIVDGIVLPNGKKETLSLEGMKKVLQGKEALRDLRRNTTFYWITLVASYPQAHYARISMCNSERNCYEFAASLHSACFRSGSSMLEGRCDALDSLSHSAWETMKNHICERCQEHYMDLMVEYRTVSWNRLPLMFGNRSWDQLKKEQVKLDKEWGN
ncbi:hypothetical protein GYMLUDRAFT_67618 [Collybiopsis luxurians FD-317 M1]|nr:hypothetical protein GYMLUDRAFT_67618 [Collybiopsis luxurians FD-317 M1]